MKLSILTPAVWGRTTQAAQLADKIRAQIQAADLVGQVEHLVLFDDKTRTIGAKRQALLDVARGQYVVFCDDDDDVAPEYVWSIVSATKSNADVIVWRQLATVNGQESTIDFNLRHQDEPFNPGGVTKRNAWHVNAWKRELVAGPNGCFFGESNYGEDFVWCLQARQRVRSQATIDAVLHYYKHDEKTTEAPAP